MRILHFADPAQGRTGPTTLALAAASYGRLQGIEQEVCLWGSSELKSHARSAGLRDAGFVSTPMGDPMLIAPRLALMLAGLPQKSIIHCWSVRSFYCSRVLGSGRTCLLHVTRPLDGNELKQVATGFSTRPGASIAVCTSATLRHQLLTRGVSPERVLVVPPGIDLSLHQPGRRQALRQKWGIEDQGTTVVALVGDPAFGPDAYRGIMAMGLDQEVENDRSPGKRVFMLLTHPHQTRLSLAVTTNLRVRDDFRVIQDAGVASPWLTLPGADVCLAFGAESAGLALLHAMASGTPIVGEATHWNCEALEDRHNALLTRPGSLQGLSHQMLGILDNPDLAWRLKENARQDIYSVYSRSTYCTRLSRVYHALAEGRLPSQSEVTPELAGVVA
jgi:glycosyltransferase involved in cell wall biosynthesis